MKKNRVKTKGGGKEAAPQAGRGQVVKLRPGGKSRVNWPARLPQVKGYFTGAKQFVAEAWQELKKVTWPNRKETVGTTGVVLLLVIIISIYLGLVDFGLSRLVRTIIH
jgi:preprotein translocase subunit SecE